MVDIDEKERRKKRKIEEGGKEAKLRDEKEKEKDERGG